MRINSCEYQFKYSFTFHFNWFEKVITFLGCVIEIHGVLFLQNTRQGGETGEGRKDV